VTAPVLLLNDNTAPVVSKAAGFHADPVQINSLSVVEFQYNAPVIKVFPSLSVVGAEDLAPR